MPGAALNYKSSALPATLSSGALATGTISLTSMPGTWPAVPFKMLVDWGTATTEAVIVTAISGTGPYTLTCTRGADGTTAQAHSSGSTAVHGFSAEEFGQAANLSAGTFNVCDPQFGAKGDGVTDDTAAIQAAANALDAQGGGRLYFPCTGRDFITTGTITLTSYGDGIHVMGDGYGSRIKATGNYDTFYVDSGNGVAFSYLYLDSTVGSNHTDSCTTTNGSPTVTDASIATSDVGKTVTGPGIPGSTTILSVSAGTSFTMSANATASATVPLNIIGSTAGYAINLQTGGSVRINNIWCYNSFRALGCFNGGGRTEIINSWLYGRDAGIYTQNPLHIIATGVSGDSAAVIMDSVNGSFWATGCDFNGYASVITRNTLAIAQPNYGATFINCGANYNGGGVVPPEGVVGWDFSSCYGELRLYACYASGSAARIGGRTDTCGTTNGSATVTDPLAISTDAGKNISGAGIPANTHILTATAGVGYTLTANATATSSSAALLIGVATQDVEIIGGDYGGDLTGRTDASCGTTNGSAVVTDTSITNADAGKFVAGTGIPAGASIASVVPGTSFTMTQNATATGTVSLAIGAFHGLPQALRIQSGQKIRVSSIQVQGAGNNTYDGILLDAPVTGPLSIKDCQYTRPVSNGINANALTSGPFNFSGNQFNGEAAGSGVLYNSSFASQFTLVGNDSGPNIVNGATLGGQSDTYAGPLTSALAGITSSSLASVTQLGVAVVSGGTYEIEFWIYLSSTTSSGPNVGFGVANPSASFGIFEILAYTNTTASREVYFSSLGSTGSLTIATTSATLPLRIKALATFTASGTVYPQLSASSGGGTTTVQAGSYAVARRIS